MLYMPGSTIPMKSEYPHMTTRMAKLIERSQILTAAGHNVVLEIDDPMRNVTNLAKTMLNRSPVHVTSALAYRPIAHVATQGTPEQAAMNLVGFGMHFKGEKAGPGIDYLSRKEFNAAMNTLKKSFGATHDAQVKSFIMSQYLSSALGFTEPSVKGVYLHPRHPHDIVVHATNPGKAAKALWSHMAAPQNANRTSQLFSVKAIPANFACSACKQPLSRGLCGSCLHNLQRTLAGSNMLRFPAPAPHQLPTDVAAPDLAAQSVGQCIWPETPKSSISGAIGNDAQYTSFEQAKARCTDLQDACSGVTQTGPNSWSVRSGTIAGNNDFSSWIKPACGNGPALSLDTAVKAAPIFFPAPHGLTYIPAEAPNKFATLEEAQARSTALGTASDGIITKDDGVSYIVVGPHAQLDPASSDKGTRSWLKLEMPTTGCLTEPVVVAYLWDTLSGGDPQTTEIPIPSLIEFLAHSFQIPANIAQVILAAADSNGDGKIQRDEFFRFACSAAFDASLGKYADAMKQAARVEEQKNSKARGHTGAEYGNTGKTGPKTLGSDPIGSHSDSGFNTGIQSAEEASGVEEYKKDAATPAGQESSHVPEFDGVQTPEIPKEYQAFSSDSIINEYDKWAGLDVPDAYRNFCSQAFPIKPEISDWNYEVGDPFANGESGIEALREDERREEEAAAQDKQLRKLLYTAGGMTQYRKEAAALQATRDKAEQDAKAALFK